MWSLKCVDLLTKQEVEVKVPLTKTYNLLNSFFVQEDCLTTTGSQIKPWFYCCYELGKLGKDYEENITGGISVPGGFFTKG